MKKKIYVVDASSLVHKEYFASVPDEIKFAKTTEEKDALYHLLPKDKNGRAVNAVDGFFTTVAALLAYQKADALAFCFDKSREGTFRRARFPEYKAQRAHAERGLKEQMACCEELCKSLGLATFSNEEFEADDFAGSIASQLASEDVEVHLLTTDRDYFQLVNDNVVVHLMTQRNRQEALAEKYGEKGGPLGTYPFDAELILSEIGLPPGLITDWKGMSGDASDNIPGIKGVADKSAVPLLSHYGSLEAIIKDVESKSEGALKEEWKALGISRPPVAQIKEGKEQGLFCKWLATIKTDIPVPNELRDYRAPISPKALKELSNERSLSFLSEFLERFPDENSWKIPIAEEANKADNEEEIEIW